ncbi:MAG: DUF2892 domain-containing protein [Dongiaceae bacterium]
MDKNVGQIDRMLRLVLGVLIFGFFMSMPGAEKWIAILGLLLIASGLLGQCMLYRILGFNSCKFDKKPPQTPPV